MAGLLGAINKVAEAAREQYGDEAVDSVLESTGVIGDSNLVTGLEVLDDNVETMHQTDAVLEAGGIDRVAMQREQAIDNAQATVEQRLLEQD
jgi:hypothetical protein